MLHLTHRRISDEPILIDQRLIAAVEPIRCFITDEPWSKVYLSNGLSFEVTEPPSEIGYQIQLAETGIIGRQP